MNISNLKSKFPVFKKNPNLVFLDTAASALKVDEMIEATNNCYTNEYANIHSCLLYTSPSPRDSV